MVRLLANLLLIPGILLTQFAAVPHVHAVGSVGTVHEGHPHFHVHLFGSNDFAGGSPARCECDRSGPSDRAEPAPPWDHDANAVYVESTTASPEREKHFAPVFFADPVLARLPHLRDARAAAHRPATGPRIVTRCPLYVRFLALTI